MVFATLVSLVALWLRGRLSLEAGGNAGQTSRSLKRPWWMALALIPIAILFFQLPISLPVWNLLPKLRFLQFPSRWLLILEAPLAIFFAAAIWPSASEPRWRRGAIGALCALLFAASIFLVSKTFRDCTPDELPGMLASFRSGAGFWGAGEYSPPNVDNDILATSLPDACLTADPNARLGVAATPSDRPNWQPNQGACIAMAGASLHGPEHLRVAIFASRAGYLVLRLRRYPAWRIAVNGQPTINLPNRTDGLIAVRVPQGPIDLKIDWTTTGDVIAGRWLSALSLVSLAALGFLARKLSVSMLG